MSNKKIKLTTDRYKREKLLKRSVILSLLFILLLLLVLHLIIGIIYNNESFSITLDRNLYYQKGLIVYDDPDYKVFRSELFATSPETFDNMSYRWLPEDLANHRGGSHNGDNYLAYTFYVENTGVDIADYYSLLVVDDVIKNVDEAIRIRIYRNGVATTYAKRNSIDNQPEANTKPFASIENADDTIILENVTNFKPGDLDRITVLVWLEGDDPDCVDALIGGELKMHMVITEEHIDQG